MYTYLYTCVANSIRYAFVVLVCKQVSHFKLSLFYNRHKLINANNLINRFDVIHSSACQHGCHLHMLHSCTIYHVYTPVHHVHISQCISCHQAHQHPYLYLGTHMTHGDILRSSVLHERFTVNSLMFAGINVCVFETKPSLQGLYLRLAWLAQVLLVI